MGLFITHNQTKFQVGDSVKVYQRIKEGEKERTQIFEGLVIGVSGHQGSKTFTVRKIASGVGVEKIFPADSPYVEKIVVAMAGTARRSKLYFLRDRTGRNALKVKQRRDTLVNTKDAKKSQSEPISKAAKSEAVVGETGGDAVEATANE